jgi:hypothetical protein
MYRRTLRRRFVRLGPASPAFERPTAGLPPPRPTRPTISAGDGLYRAGGRRPQAVLPLSTATRALEGGLVRRGRSDDQIG